MDRNRPLILRKYDFTFSTRPLNSYMRETQGGTFLYVATVLQPVSSSSPGSGHNHGEGELKPAVRVLLTVLGMFFPLVAGGVLGHGHEH
jgi:hypothetical protein